MRTSVTWLVLCVLVLGMSFAVYERADRHTQAVGPALWHGYSGDADRSVWRARPASLWLARLAAADRHPALWLAAWFFLSCLVWLAALQTRALVPIVVCALGTVIAYSTPFRVGTIVSDGPMLFLFTLAAVTARARPMVWVVLGLLIIPFKATGAMLCIAAAGVTRDWRRALVICSAMAVTMLACRVVVESHHPHTGALRLLLNWYSLYRPEVLFVMGGLVFGGVLAAQGRVLAVLLMLVGAALVFANLWEPRLWFEALPLVAVALVTLTEDAPNGRLVGVLA